MNENERFFDPRQAFFVIGSDDLGAVKSRFYGFSVQGNGIFEQSNMTPEALRALDGNGCYVSVEADAGKIIIRQDCMGSYGLYLYQDGNRHFALSNSFHSLLEHVRGKWPLTLNRDFAYDLCVEPLCAMSRSRTAVNEIRLLDKDSVVTIDVEDLRFSEQVIHRGRMSISPDSPQGLVVLDAWFSKWTGIFRELAKASTNVEINLSGGFDSRMTFMLALKSGMDLNAVCVSSFDDKLHGHDEDFRIASQIARRYGFRLNVRRETKPETWFTCADKIDASGYVKMGFHKEMYFQEGGGRAKRYLIPGFGGECVRAHYRIDAQAIIDLEEHFGDRYHEPLATKVRAAVRRALHDSCIETMRKYGIGDVHAKNLPSLVYDETRNRAHFGKAMVERYLGNVICLTPLMDPLILQLKTEASECHDENFLMALMYARYCPELLEFGFQDNRTIPQEVIDYAKAVCERNPYPVRQEDEDVNEVRYTVATASAGIEQSFNRDIQHSSKIENVEEIFRSIFTSAEFEGRWKRNFESEIYDFALKSIEREQFHSLREAYALMAIVKVINDVEISESAINPSLSSEIQRFFRVEQRGFEKPVFKGLKDRFYYRLYKWVLKKAKRRGWTRLRNLSL